MPELNSEQIRAIRGACGEAQVAFARRIGCTVCQVSRWENNHQVPSPVFTRKLSRLAQQKGLAL